MTSQGEETTIGRHRHQGSWTITYEDKPQSNSHYEIHTCGVCGIVFALRKEGPAPAEG